jgi:hypothetical protein
LQKLNAVDAPLLSFQAHLLLGNAQRMWGEWSAAYESYNCARLELEKLRSTVQGEELRISFLRDKVCVYENLVDVCLHAQTARPVCAADAEIEPDTVFGYMEQAKSRTLAETLFSRSSRLNWADAGGGSAEQVRKLKGELNWLYHRIESEQTSPHEISVERIRSLRAEARRYEDLLVRMFREMDGMRSHSPVLSGALPIDPSEIRAALHPDAAIVEYFQTATEFVAAVVTTSGTQMFQLGPVAQVSSHIRMLEFQLSKFRLRNSYPDSFHDALLASTLNRLRELHRDLFGPIAHVLKGRHIVVVPHGILHHVPFHALFDGSQYLIDQFTVSVAPSATIYTACTQKPANAQGRALIMGVQDENAPYIENEVRAVAGAVPQPQVFLGADATTHVLRTAGPESRLIHIATHGYFRSDNAMFSSVRMADGYLSLYDLYELRLPVGLLALSGCGTGLNGVAAGDELLGLTRGLLCSGARSLLLSLWDVHDRTTAEFMSSFYSRLGTQRDKALALRAAMLETRARHPHPYFWAPFVLVGKVMN